MQIRKLCYTTVNNFKAEVARGLTQSTDNVDMMYEEEDYI